MKFSENRMFMQMRAAAVAQLSGKDPNEIAQYAGVSYDPGASVFRFQSLGYSITVSYPSYTITPEVDGWHHLLILHYLFLADGTALTNRLISFGETKNGLVRGGEFDRRSETSSQMLLKRHTIPELTARCLELGGQILTTNADFAAQIPVFPHYPVTLKLWLPDEDFDASGRMLLDASADHYLTVEDAVAVGDLLWEMLLV